MAMTWNERFNRYKQYHQAIEMFLIQQTPTTIADYKRLVDSLNDIHKHCMPFTMSVKAETRHSYMFTPMIIMCDAQRDMRWYANQPDDGSKRASDAMCHLHEYASRIIKNRWVLINPDLSLGKRSSIQKSKLLEREKFSMKEYKAAMSVYELTIDIIRESDHRVDTFSIHDENWNYFKDEVHRLLDIYIRDGSVVLTMNAKDTVVYSKSFKNGEPRKPSQHKFKLVRARYDCPLMDRERVVWETGVEEDKVLFDCLKNL